MNLKNKLVRYALAVVACTVIFVGFGIIIGLMKLENSGGIVMMLILLAALTATWRGITKLPKQDTVKVPPPDGKDNSNSENK